MADEPQDRVPEDGDFLAAEYALGVLSAADRRLAERQMRENSAFATDVAFWQERLAPIGDAVTSVEPPEAVWDAIAAEAGLVSRRPVVEPERPRLWNNLNFWRGLATGSVALAAASAAALIVFIPAPAQPPLFATLETQDTAASFVAAYDRSRGTLIVIPAAARVGEARVPELWIIPGDGVPRSLGVIDSRRPHTIRIPESHRQFAMPDATLAVSLEPPGGSPTGKPTGPVIAHGSLSSL